MAFRDSSSTSGDSREDEMESSASGLASLFGDISSGTSGSDSDEDDQARMARRNASKLQGLVHSAFSNPLIKDNIMKHLSFGEMKSLSLSSNPFNNMIRQSKEFKKKAVLVIPDNEGMWFDDDTENLDLESLLFNSYYAHVANYPWRGLKIDLATKVKPRVLDKVIPFSNSLEYLAFVKMNPITCIWPGMFNVMQNLLRQTPNLKHLSLDHVVFFKETSGGSKLGDIFLDHRVQRNLANLERLDICEIDFAQQTFSGICDDFDWRRRQLAPEKSMNSFIHLAKIPMTLRVFKTNRMTTNWELKECHVALLLKNNRETLEELWMHASLWKMKELKELCFPNLKILHVTLRSEESDQEILAEFLKNHSQIQELDVQILKHGTIYFVLIDSIQEYCKNLTKLHLEASVYSGGFNGRNAIDWSFLKSMKQLVDVKIVFPHEDAFGVGEEILTNLSKTRLHTLKLESDVFDKCYFWVSDEKKNDNEDQLEEISRERKIRMRGPLGRSMRMSLRNYDYKPVTEMEVESEPTLQIYKRNLLLEFTSLKSLCIMAKDAIDDFLMQFIIKEFNSLEELEIGYCSKLTDIGVTGMWGDTVLGVSISEMKGLKKLIIRECPHVTHDGILKSVRFKGLEYLDYRNSHFLVPQSFVIQIVKQNPSLEEIALKFYFEENDEEFRHEALLYLLCNLKEVNPRLVKMWGCLKTQSYWAHTIFGSGTNIEGDREP